MISIAGGRERTRTRANVRRVLAGLLQRLGHERRQELGVAVAGEGSKVPHRRIDALLSVLCAAAQAIF